MHETLIDSWGDASEVMTRLIGSWSLNRIVEGKADDRHENDQPLGKSQFAGCRFRRYCW